MIPSYVIKYFPNKFFFFLKEVSTFVRRCTVMLIQIHVRGTRFRCIDISLTIQITLNFFHSNVSSINNQHIQHPSSAVLLHCQILHSKFGKRFQFKCLRFQPLRACQTRDHFPLKHFMVLLDQTLIFTQRVSCTSSVKFFSFPMKTKAISFDNFDLF